VAIISPSAGLPQLFPEVFELGLARIREEFDLVPKEYPTTRVMGASLKDRARDIMAAFADPENKAVIASIGGDDQLKLIKYLDPEVFVNNPKPFLGYSDNTHLHNFLWHLGIPSYYGGGVMNQFGMHGAMTEITKQSVRHALFESGEKELPVATEYNDIGVDWRDASRLVEFRTFEPNDGLFWHGNESAEGILWGGCVESLIFQVAAHKYLPSAEDFSGAILCIETAEDIPEPWLVGYLLAGFGERGWFDKFAGVLVGRPKAWEFDKQKTTEEKAQYCAEQREIIVKTIREYNPSIPIVQNLDFGHTDPQVLLPLGNKARIDVATKKIFLTY